MPVYRYRAYDKNGRDIGGLVDAESLAAARRRLRAQGVHPYDLAERHRSATVRRAGRRRVPRAEVWAATRQLATLLEAGLPLVAGLEAVQRQTHQGALAAVLADLKEAVREGSDFAGALERYPALFSPVYVNMVRAAERSGALGPVLARLADLGEEQVRLAGRVKAAMVYPLFMTVIGTAILIGLLAFVVPGVVDMFAEMRAALPWPTRLLIALSDGAVVGWPWLLAGVVAAGAAFLALRRRPGFRRRLDRLALTLPLAGPLLRRVLVARFARTTAGLLTAGVPLATALRIVHNVVNNAPLAAALAGAADEVEQGRGLAAALEDIPWIGPLVVQLVAAGEQSGSLDRMLNRVADTYEREAENRIVGLTALLEPVLILLMGVAVGFVVLAVLLPIFEMQRLIH